METLTGIIDRVTFHTEDTGYSVLKVRVPGKYEPVTVTGRLASAHEGEGIEATGEWVTVASYGRQFKAESIATTAPSTREGIEKYLGSGLIEGIGPVYAGKLVKAFGERIFDVIDQESKRLEEVEGIGRKRRQEIKASWEKQKSIREIMVFLHNNGISTSKAVKIYQAYGEQAAEIVKSDPYRLAQDIYGIGFKSADAIARRLGMAPDSGERIRAAISHLLLAAGDEGHCALPSEEIQRRAAEMLALPAERISSELDVMVENLDVVRETIGAETLVFPPHLARAEREIAREMRTLAALPPRHPPVEIDRALEWAQQQTGKTLAPGQQEAVRAALRSRVLIITGGPGVGKTTILNTILKILLAKRVKIVLAAPTGRAARRMAESTGHEAKTIHRLLEYQPGKGFTRNRESPLKGDLFVLDETSMVDVALFANYLRALPEACHLLIVGDADQLPSVGPGNLLRDLIQSATVPTVRLTEIFRQAGASAIIRAAHDINAGKCPSPASPSDKTSDFHFVERATPEAVAETIVHLARDRMPAAFRFDPIRDIQVLTPMNRTPLGSVALNTALQAALNPPNEFKPEIERFGMLLRRGDKVIQIRNNYEKDVFNGDIGIVGDIIADPLRVEVRFEDGRCVDYESGDLDELRLAYAITIHKSQGSEFPAVIIPVSTQHYVMLQRNLIYTAVTRGRKQVVLVGDPKALQISVRNHGAGKRWSGLLWRLTQPPGTDAGAGQGR